MSVVSTIAAAAIAASISLTAVEPVMNFYGWAVQELNVIGTGERERQQVIQDLVCEANHSPDCPTVPPWEEVAP